MQCGNEATPVKDISEIQSTIAVSKQIGTKNRRTKWNKYDPIYTLINTRFSACKKAK